MLIDRGFYITSSKLFFIRGLNYQVTLFYAEDMMKWIRIPTLLFWVFCSGLAAQEHDSSAVLIDRLVKEGFENIRVNQERSFLRVSYENRVYRHEVEAFAIVAALAVQESQAERLILIPQSQDVALAEIEFAAQSFRQFAQGEIEGDAFVKSMIFREPGKRTGQRHNASFLKTDVLLYPRIAMQMGNWENRYKWRVSLVPQLDMTLMPSLFFQGRMLIPIKDEIKSTRSEQVRLAQAVFQGIHRLPGHVYASVRAGVFEPERYGVSVEAMRFLLGRQALLNVQFDRTGFLWYQEGVWNYSDLETQTWRAEATWFFSWVDLSVSAGYGQYLHGDKGPFARMFRRVGDTQVGFTVSNTDLDTYAQLHLVIPLAPRKRPAPGRVRIQYPFYYRMGFMAQEDVTRINRWQNPGVTVQGGLPLADWNRHLVPAFFINNVDFLQQIAREKSLSGQ
ncbi:hypothetical protein GF406_15805 [candidate division KSB1 bacterium]|nr:hypothetical protein [candidate division KSB1 bacterium]